MTERKPFGVPYEDWVDRQVREAQERGEFDNLPGAGKPIKGLDRPWDLTHWAAEMLRRENLSILPPALELRRHVERELAEIMELGHEIGVRKAVETLNQHIRDTNKAIYEGPASLVRPLSIEDVVASWKAARADG
jgi:hypothetical protein